MSAAAETNPGDADGRGEGYWQGEFTNIDLNIISYLFTLFFKPRLLMSSRWYQCIVHLRLLCSSELAEYLSQSPNPKIVLSTTSSLIMSAAAETNPGDADGRGEGYWQGEFTNIDLHT
jgi:hypothetical protein